jgi:hypothetical protein
MLSEVDQRDLDEKVLSHVAAQEIEQRIERVLGNLDLPSPQVDATGLSASANSMAEFLDNALPEDCLGPFESNCIESDVQLCEAAECHHLLSEMLGQQGLIEGLPLNERQILVKLTEAKAALLLSQEGQAAGIDNARSMRVELDAIDAGSNAETSQGVVGLREKKQYFAPAALIVAVALLILLVSAFGFQVFSIFGNRRFQQQVAQQPSSSDLSPKEINVSSKGVAPSKQAADIKKSSEKLSGEEDGEQAVEQLGSSDGMVKPRVEDLETPESTPSIPVQKEPASPVVGTTAAANPSMVTNARVSQGTAMAIGGPLGSVPNAPAASLETNSGTRDINSDLVSSNRGEPVLGFLESDANIGWAAVLHRNRLTDRGELDGWLALPTESMLGVYEEIQVPPGLSPVLDVGGVTVRMKPRTHAVFKLDSLQKPRIELLSGSMIIRSGNDADQIGIAAGGLNGIILSGLSGSVTINVSGMPDDLLSARQTKQSQVARILAQEKPILWRQTQPGGLAVARPLRGLPEEFQLAPREILEWSEISPLEASRRIVNSLPPWAVSSRPLSRLEKSASEALAEAITQPDSLLKSLIELSDSSRIENRIIATETLALLGWYDQVIELLAASPRPGLGPSAELWIQLESESIPAALADKTLALAVKKSLRDHVNPEQGDVLVGLATRTLHSESFDVQVTKLIDLLEDENIIFRRYAIQWLRELFVESTSDVIKYRADWNEKQLAEGSDWWRKRFQQGLLKRRSP